MFFGRVVEGFDGGVNGVGNVADYIFAGAELFEDFAAGGDEDAVDVVFSGVDFLDVFFLPEGVDVAVDEFCVREIFSNFEEGLVGNDVAVSEQDDVGAEVDAGFEEFSICGTVSQRFYLQRGFKLSDVAVGEFADIPVVADHTVEELASGGDFGFSVAADLYVVDVYDAHNVGGLVDSFGFSGFCGLFDRWEKILPVAEAVEMAFLAAAEFAQSFFQRG